MRHPNEDSIMALSHELVIRLDKHLSGQVDRLLEIWEANAVDVSKLLAADRALRPATEKLGEAVDDNQPQT